MTEQQIFNQVYNALKTQNFEQALNPMSAMCQLRIVTTDDKMLKCAIGHLIPDSEYNGAMEKYGTFRKGLDLGKTVCDLAQDHHELLYRLQKAHDGGESPAGMVNNLLDVARSYGLTVPK